MLLLLACSTPTPTEPPQTCSAPAPAPEGCGDLNCDGTPDLVFARTEDAAGNYVTTSVILWGGDPADTTELPTLGAADVAVADLDRDDWPDLVFADLSDGEARTVDSYVYWNGPDGFSADNRTALPTVGASDVEVADLDGDGWRDLVFANRYDGGSAASEESYQVDVWAYLGGPDGFDATRRLAIPGFGAAQTAVADFDGDGAMDLAIAAGTFHTNESWVYFGGDGFSVEGRVSLATAAPEGVIAADLDDDGWEDLAFANFYAEGDLEIDSTVYWGGQDGFAESTPFPTTGADDLVAVDLDGDHCRELAVANAMEGTFFEMDFEAESAVWAFDGREMTRTAALPTLSAAALAAGDVDSDGATDLVFANRYDAAGDAASAVSSVYYGPDFAESTAIPVVAAAGVAIAGP